MNFMVSVGANPIFEMKINSPLVAKGYPLSGETIYKKQNNYALILEITD